MDDFSIFVKQLFYYCLQYRKNTESKNPTVAKAKIGRIMLLSQCAVFDSKKSNLLKSKKLG